ncbi:Alpha-mannosidase 2x [Strongyloides ratti]|uniref:Alpha-mannosidase n=1 Tax=Strongyloides ratti TaxID=34506 RepID=A0A090L0V7_STRRB|nr:Alpha-mannosidase 2x [Strongyloides ratti]CEF61124.1 Alpha-mannosidase 2x [Strongyloides ratti]
MYIKYRYTLLNTINTTFYKKNIFFLLITIVIFIYLYLYFYLSPKDVEYEINKYFFKPQNDEQMLNIYSNIKFKEYLKVQRKSYFDITYNKNNMRKINVFLIPHSHDDPGWLKTFEEYYNDEVSKILYGMLEYLSENNKMKFVYVEMSFFELFYSTLTLKNREKIKKLLNDEKLEIITGGWVMSDEANSHFFSQITELFEGHEFLRNNLQYIPKNHWSIDPFGLSPTMTYIIKESGFKHMAIQRVHYMVKQYFAEKKLFEFQWRQLWSGGYKNDSQKTDIFTHIFPYGSYTSSETCGPDKNICEKFDFSKPSNNILNNNIILQKNIKMIVDQFRKKSVLFRGPNIFVPLGTDFSYSKKDEWKNVYDNYKIIIDNINNSSEYNMHIQFGTLNDYFKANDKSLLNENIHIPVITGDFFTYADRNEEYWSGYYTSRPFYKRFDRILMDYLRSAEIIYSIVLGKTNSNEMNQFLKLVDYNKLVYARRALSLFQHHDGVTGTSKNKVVLDYGKKLFKAMQNCYSIIEKSIEYDMTKQLFDKSKISILNKINDSTKIPKVKSININSDILIFNPHSKNLDNEILCTKIESKKIFIIKNIDINNQEIHPIIEKENNKLVISNISYLLCYIVSLKPFEIEILKLIPSDNVNIKPKISKIFTSQRNITTNKLFNNYDKIIDDNNYFIVSELHGLKIDKKTGYVTSINNSPVSIHFEYYNETSYNPHSGAYLFTPEGSSKILNNSKNYYIISKGNIRQEVVVIGPNEGKIIHTIESKISFPHYIDINNVIDLNNEKEIEIVMKIKTNNGKNDEIIKNKNVFFTDLNGYQIIKRKRLDKLPIQGNFYPMPSIIYIEDTNKRLTVLGNQALGCSSQEEGSVEIILDRKHLYDDNRGLGHGILDNIPTKSKFRILIEKKYISTEFNDDQIVTGYLSINAFLANQKLQYNLIQMEIDKSINNMNYKLSIIKNEFPSNIHIVTLRTLTAPENYEKGGVPDCEYNRIRRKPLKNAALILQNIAYDNKIGKNTSPKLKIKNGKIYINDYFKENFINLYEETSLTLLYNSNNFTSNGYININPMELKTLKTTFSEV